MLTIILICLCTVAISLAITYLYMRHLKRTGYFYNPNDTAGQGGEVMPEQTPAASGQSQETDHIADGITSTASSDNSDPTADKSKEDAQSDNTRNPFEHRQFLLDTLRELGCSPTLSDDSESIFVKYQGESFSISQNHAFIRIWDLPFAQINVLDPNLPLLQETINKVNKGIGPTLLLDSVNEHGTRTVYSKMDLVLIPSIPDTANYLGAILEMFFDLKNSFHKEIARWQDDNTDDADTNFRPHPCQN